MCIAYEQRCKCGCSTASFHFKDNVLSEKVLRDIYCPECSSGVAFNHEHMVADNGWVIEYDMDVARFLAQQKLTGSVLTPEFIFDAGYCTWNGIYPNDHADSARERQSITATAKIDPLSYLKEIKRWGTERMERLRNEGWRKARSEMV